MILLRNAGFLFHGYRVFLVQTHRASRWSYRLGFIRWRLGGLRRLVLGLPQPRLLFAASTLLLRYQNTLALVLEGATVVFVCLGAVAHVGKLNGGMSFDGQVPLLGCLSFLIRVDLSRLQITI